MEPGTSTLVKKKKYAEVSTEGVQAIGSGQGGGQARNKGKEKVGTSAPTKKRHVKVPSVELPKAAECSLVIESQPVVATRLEEEEEILVAIW